jgi:hypothetical protein
MEAAECFEHGCLGPGPGLDGIEEVNCVDEEVGFFTIFFSPGIFSSLQKIITLHMLLPGPVQ